MKAPLKNEKKRPIPVWMRYAPVYYGLPNVLPVRSRNRFSQPSDASLGVCPKEKQTRLALMLGENSCVCHKKKGEKI